MLGQATRLEQRRRVGHVVARVCVVTDASRAERSGAVLQAARAARRRPGTARRDWCGTRPRPGSAAGTGSRRSAGPGRAGVPGMPVSSTRGPRIDGNASSSPWLYGWAGVSNTVRVGAGLDHLAGVHHQQLVGEVADQRHVVGDEDDREAELLLQFLDLHHQRPLGDDVQRRRRLVHDDQVGREQQRHRDHRALPHAAAELVRVALAGGSGRCRPARITSTLRCRICAAE